MSGGDWKDLYHAAENGDFALARYHLQEGVDPNYQHPEVMCSPLVASLIHGHDEVAQLLLAHGADPNLPSDFDDLTPLEAAQRHERQVPGRGPTANRSGGAGCPYRAMRFLRIILIN
jgi:ankyrin repeat protein